MKSQNDEILKDLMAGEKITCLDAWKRYGSSALHSRAADLRKMGIPLQSVRIKVKGKGGEIKSVNSYFLSPDYIKSKKVAS